jgi:glycerophosphoryl diester phosphodiesterase
MLPLWENLPRPLIIAHRGASHDAPENTLAAFRLAVREHAEAVELDAKLTRDGRIVVMHDNTVDRTTNGHGAVRKMDWEALHLLNAGGEDGDPETGIPLLEDVLRAVTPDLLVNIELTNYAAPLDALPVKVADLLDSLGVAKRVWVSSFNPLTLLRFARRMPEVPIGFLVDVRRPWLYRWFRHVVPHVLVEPHLALVTPEAVRRWHAQGKTVAVYTVNDAADMKRLFAWGVDGIYTDDPHLALEVREAFLADRR